MFRATEFAHHLLQLALQPGAWAVDATVGNGHDTLFLAQLVGPTGRVFGFDVQATALTVAAQRVAHCPQVALFHAGHEELQARLPEDATGRLAAVMFNLGYLPGAPKETITHAETTLVALQQAVPLLQIGGLLTVILYPGHPGGEIEASVGRNFLETLPASFAVSQYRRLNSRAPAPELLIVERQS
jgi:predicted methyltransferase